MILEKCDIILLIVFLLLPNLPEGANTFGAKLLAPFKRHLQLVEI